VALAGAGRGKWGQSAGFGRVLADFAVLAFKDVFLQKLDQICLKCVILWKKAQQHWRLRPPNPTVVTPPISITFRAAFLALTHTFTNCQKLSKVAIATAFASSAFLCLFIFHTL